MRSRHLPNIMLMLIGVFYCIAGVGTYPAALDLQARDAHKLRGLGGEFKSHSTHSDFPLNFVTIVQS